MEESTRRAAELAYETYRGYAGGKHPVSKIDLPPFRVLNWQAQAAWAKVAISLKVHYSQ